jgi:hypothetical protein
MLSSFSAFGMEQEKQKVHSPKATKVFVHTKNNENAEEEVIEVKGLTPHTTILGLKRRISKSDGAPAALQRLYPVTSSFFGLRQNVSAEPAKNEALVIDQHTNTFMVALSTESHLDSPILPVNEDKE